METQKIEQIKAITIYSKDKFHGNQKKVGLLTISEYREILKKKQNRFINNYVCKDGSIVYSYQFKKPIESEKKKLIDLIKWSLKCKGSNYFKILIEGNTHIYYAHPEYRHSDYNKSKPFELNEKTKKYIEIFNRIVKS